MGTLKLIFSECIKILSIRFSLGNYSFSLYGFILFEAVSFLLIWIVFKLFD